MSFNIKSVIIAIIIFVTVPFGLRWYYNKTHPRYVLPPPTREEVTLTIIPGWNLRQVAEYLVLKEFASSTDLVLEQTGKPAKFFKPKLVLPDFSGVLAPWIKKPTQISYEGYFAPETIRVYRNARLAEVLEKFALERHRQLLVLRPDSAGDLSYNWHEILTMASIVEEEASHDEDRAKVADILWRRFKAGWALQVDSSVHYAVDKTGDLFTTAKERQIDSPWNTYKYPGLPPSPICNPGLSSIEAAVHPEKNEYWYFLSGRDGKMHYAKTLEEHNANKKYL